MTLPPIDSILSISDVLIGLTVLFAVYFVFERVHTNVTNKRRNDERLMQELLEEERKQADIEYKHKLMHEARVFAAKSMNEETEEELNRLSSLVYRKAPTDEELTEINEILKWLEKQASKE